VDVLTLMPAPVATGVVAALAWLLLGAGAAKLPRRGAPALAAGELALGALALVIPGRAAAALVASAFTGFTVTHLRAWRDERADCGCFGNRSAASMRRASGLTAAAALAGAASAVAGPASLLHLATHDPGQAVFVLLGSGTAALAWWAAFTGMRGSVARAGLGRAGDRLVESSARFLEQRLTRRTALVRLAVVGSALSVAPLRYLLYPGTALAAIVPGDCGGGLCTDGYTVFCCEIHQGLNTCPEGTFVGGWWMCTDYPGRQLCAEEGRRYYVDCNRTPGVPFPGGCRCADNSCEHRRVACNVFRYGQCNPQIAGVTEVVCRMVVCENPSQIPALNCSASVAVDDSVCDQDVPCLEPPAVELAAAGGV